MRFLVIDDEFVALNRVVALLTPHGECEAATHASQALEMFRAALKEGAPYNLVTVDIDIPGQDGVELLREMRSLERVAHMVPTKIIMVTADNSETNVRRARGAHCDAYLVKPVTKQALTTKLIELKLISPLPPGSPLVPSRHDTPKD